ncbi:ureidoglycolate lyase [Exilibacterium tricleocarpae]|uniref:Ureidoglycolate lyase n=1 Tax=Exilibacterium tricleocarpae TaxID=2591008 RepID=A0A545U9S1_9GAMM|nr:ureidoglycolate lyase [Exilibacterium tricleocarpae]TQV86224.1 ureidoglycolate lyase [Exilibacterium tricleocarpae]
MITPEPLSAAAFAAFGDVIECGDRAKRIPINYGNTLRFHDLAELDVTGGNGRPLMSIFRSTPLPRPIDIKVMERHPLSSQAFYPLSGHPYLVAVAPAGVFDLTRVRVFLAGPTQGVNYAAGTWHHYSLALDAVSEFLVIDRGGPGDNCDEVTLEPSQWLRVDY